jgi:hypothetical protein
MRKYPEFKERKLMYSLLPKNEAEFFLRSLIAYIRIRMP